MTRYIPPPDAHDCVAQNALGGAATVPVGTLAQCEACGRWWHVRVVEIGYHSGPEWMPVRWWHLRLRRRVKRSCAAR